MLMLMGEPGTPHPPKDVRDRGNFPQETKPRDPLGMNIVERPKCGSLVALQAWVLQRAARDGDVREEEEVTEGREMKRGLG